MRTGLSLEGRMINKQFLLAGRAVFTVDNGKGEHYTFRIVAKPDLHRPGKEIYFASMLTAPEHFTYVGLVNAETIGNRNWNVRLTKASKFNAGTKPYRVLCWALQQVAEQATLPAGYSIQHAGRCGRCGRELTTPESIETGFGPECSEKLGIEWGRKVGETQLTLV